MITDSLNYMENSESYGERHALFRPVTAWEILHNKEMIYLIKLQNT